MMPSGRRLPGVVAGLDGLGMKHMSASLSGASSAAVAGHGRCPACEFRCAARLAPAVEAHSFQAAAAADPVGTDLCGRLRTPVLFVRSCDQVNDPRRLEGLAWGVIRFLGANINALEVC